jgi:hypothetical protein
VIVGIGLLFCRLEATQEADPATSSLARVATNGTGRLALSPRLLTRPFPQPIRSLCPRRSDVPVCCAGRSRDTAEKRRTLQCPVASFRCRVLERSAAHRAGQSSPLEQGSLSSNAARWIIAAASISTSLSLLTMRSNIKGSLQRQSK